MNLYEKEIASNCCASAILKNTDICSECGEHSAPVLLSDLEDEDLIKIQMANARASVRKDNE